MLEGACLRRSILRRLPLSHPLSYAIEACADVEPQLVQIKPNHLAACIRIVLKPDVERLRRAPRRAGQHLAVPTA